MAIDKGAWFENQAEVATKLQNISDDGLTFNPVTLNAGTGGFTTITTSAITTGQLTTQSTIKMSNVPTSDPGVAGQVWSDSGTLKISSGT